MSDQLTFVVVTYQSAAVIDICLAALLRVPSTSIIVVDNDSTDGTMELCAAREVTLLRNRRNLGFAAAANLGAVAAPDGLVCFINPDCSVEPAIVDEARHALASAPNACAVPYFSGGRAEPQAGRQPGYSWRKILSDVLDTNRRLPAISARLKTHAAFHDVSWHWPLGTCLFIERRVFLELGGFDDSYFLYMEDVELGLALRRASGEVIQLKGTLPHGQSASSSIHHRSRNDILDRARVRFARRHYGSALAALLWLVHVSRR